MGGAGWGQGGGGGGGGGGGNRLKRACLSPGLNEEKHAACRKQEEQDRQALSEDGDGLCEGRELRPEQRERGREGLVGGAAAG